MTFYIRKLCVLLSYFLKYPLLLLPILLHTRKLQICKQRWKILKITVISIYCIFSLRYWRGFSASRLSLKFAFYEICCWYFIAASVNYLFQTKEAWLVQICLGPSYYDLKITKMKNEKKWALTFHFIKFHYK